MATKLSNGTRIPRDDSKIYWGDSLEVKWWCTELNATYDELEEAIDKNR